MISSDVLTAADALRDKFQSARPFRHVCIDNFFEFSACESLLEDFPNFNKFDATNEFGQIGRKAINTRLPEISEFYKKVYEYLFSPEVLMAMSSVTGIPDLIGDPTMYGGGTHENLDGQELDPHIDFNYMEGYKVHRRANLLLYLNKDWQEEWGGQIELHSNPRDVENNEITAFNVIFNRAVIFETNEISWHGFPRVTLPANQSSRSRKCLSVYLYTKERPNTKAQRM